MFQSQLYVIVGLFMSILLKLLTYKVTPGKKWCVVFLYTPPVYISLSYFLFQI